VGDDKSPSKIQIHFHSSCAVRGVVHYVEYILAFCAGMLGALIMLKLSFVYMPLA